MVQTSEDSGFAKVFKIKEKKKETRIIRIATFRLESKMKEGRYWEVKRSVDCADRQKNLGNM